MRYLHNHAETFGPYVDGRTVAAYYGLPDSEERAFLGQFTAEELQSLPRFLYVEGDGRPDGYYPR